MNLMSSQSQKQQRATSCASVDAYTSKAHLLLLRLSIYYLIPTYAHAHTHTHADTHTHARKHTLLHAHTYTRARVLVLTIRGAGMVSWTWASCCSKGTMPRAHLTQVLRTLGSEGRMKSICRHVNMCM